MARGFVNVGAPKKEDLSTLNSHVSNKSNPHGVTKSQVGLGNVPNVATNDQTPTYTQASSLANLTSGEKLSVSFGKIMKAIADFITHKNSTSNPHRVTAAQAGAVPTSRKVNGKALSADITLTAADVSADASGAATTVQNNLNSHTGNTSNPHSVTKSQVGLGNVPNVATNDQTPTFTTASSRANIATGEKLYVILGKIAKYFADLKTVAFTGSYTDLSNKPTIPAAVTVDSALSSSSTNPVQNKIINSALAGKAASSHNQAARTITAGTFAGQVVANSSGETYSNYCLRNTRLASADTNPTVNGEICWTYG